MPSLALSASKPSKFASSPVSKKRRYLIESTRRLVRIYQGHAALRHRMYVHSVRPVQKISRNFADVAALCQSVEMSQG
jgi:hypothetical protein